MNQKKLERETKKIQKRLDSGKKHHIVFSFRTRKILFWAIIILCAVIIPLAVIFGVQNGTHYGEDNNNPNLNPNIQKNLTENKGE